MFVVRKQKKKLAHAQDITQPEEVTQWEEKKKLAHAEEVTQPEEVTQWEEAGR